VLGTIITEERKESGGWRDGAAAVLIRKKETKGWMGNDCSCLLKLTLFLVLQGGALLTYLAILPALTCFGCCPFG
jgi:hypothetical protein